jgi:hypothetical protein
MLPSERVARRSWKATSLSINDTGENFGIAVGTRCAHIFALLLRCFKLNNVPLARKGDPDGDFYVDVDEMDKLYNEPSITKEGRSVQFLGLSSEAGVLATNKGRIAKEIVRSYPSVDRWLHELTDTFHNDAINDRNYGK